MTNIFRIESSIYEQPFLASLDAQVETNSRMVELLFRTGVEETLLFTIDVDLEEGRFMVALTSSVTLVFVCLAGCGVSSIAGVIIDCWSETRHASDRRQAFIDCLKSKGANIASNYIQCAIGCLTGGLGAYAPKAVVFAS